MQFSCPNNSSANMQSCLICFNEVNLNIDKTGCDPQTLFETCSKYLHSAITNQVVNGQKSGQNICNRCIQSAEHLTDLTDKLKVFQKTVSEYILLFSLEIFQRRADLHKKDDNIDVFGKKLVLCDLSGVSDFKETGTKTQDLPFAQAPSNSLEFESSNFAVEGNPDPEQNILVDPFTIPGEPMMTNVVTFETIIKTERNENEFTIQNYEQPGEVEELQLTTQHEGVAHYKKNVLAEQTVQKTHRSRRTGKKVANKLNLIPFVKLERLKLPEDNESSTPTESGNSNNTNSIGYVKVYDNEHVLLQSKNVLSVVDTAKSMFANQTAPLQLGTVARYRTRSNNELDPDPDYEVNKTFQCSICRKTFRHKHALKSHIKRIHTAEKRFKCTHCTKQFLHRGNLNVHLKTHTGKKDAKISVTLSDFSRHLTSAHTLEVKPFTNPNTHLSSPGKLKGKLKKIKQNWENEIPYICPVCRKKFTYKKTLKSHFRVHPGYRPYKCAICRKTFRLQSSYCTHKKLHSKTPEMLESQQFTSQQVLSSHIRIPTAERPYQCSICNRAFQFKSNHTVHMKRCHAPIHTGEKPFKCDQCDYACSQAVNLAKHKLHRHSTVYQFKCRDCGRPFKTTGQIKKHYKSVHFAIDFTNECVLKNSDIEEVP